MEWRLQLLIPLPNVQMPNSILTKWNIKKSKSHHCFKKEQKWLYFRIHHLAEFCKTKFFVNFYSSPDKMFQVLGQSITCCFDILSQQKIMWFLNANQFDLDTWHFSSSSPLSLLSWNFPTWSLVMKGIPQILTIQSPSFYIRWIATFPKTS